MVSPIRKHLPPNIVTESILPVEGSLNIQFAVEAKHHCGVFLSHGIADKLYTNTNTRQSALSLAQNLTQNRTNPAQSPPAAGAANQPAVANEPAGAEKTGQSALGLLKSLEKTDLLGWRGESAAYFSDFSHNIGRFFMKLFGFILTTLTLSLGAPYWFDVLNKLNQTIRTAGVKPEPSTTTK
jgi:hypothetical protein